MESFAQNKLSPVDTSPSPISCGYPQPESNDSKKFFTSNHSPWSINSSCLADTSQNSASSSSNLRNRFWVDKLLRRHQFPMENKNKLPPGVDYVVPYIASSDFLDFSKVSEMLQCPLLGHVIVEPYQCALCQGFVCKRCMPQLFKCATCNRNNSYQPVKRNEYMRVVFQKASHNGEDMSFFKDVLSKLESSEDIVLPSITNKGFDITNPFDHFRLACPQCKQASSYFEISEHIWSVCPQQTGQCPICKADVTTNLTHWQHQKDCVAYRLFNEQDQKMQAICEQNASILFHNNELARYNQELTDLIELKHRQFTGYLRLFREQVDVRKDLPAVAVIVELINNSTYAGMIRSKPFIHSRLHNTETYEDICLKCGDGVTFSTYIHIKDLPGWGVVILSDICDFIPVDQKHYADFLNVPPIKDEELNLFSHYHTLKFISKNNFSECQGDLHINASIPLKHEKSGYFHCVECKIFLCTYCASLLKTFQQKLLFSKIEPYNLPDVVNQEEAMNHEDDVMSDQ